MDCKQGQAKIMLLVFNKTNFVKYFFK